MQNTSTQGDIPQCIEDIHERCTQYVQKIYAYICNVMNLANGHLECVPEEQ